MTIDERTAAIQYHNQEAEQHQQSINNHWEKFKGIGKNTRRITLVGLGGTAAFIGVEILTKNPAVVDVLTAVAGLGLTATAGVGYTIIAGFNRIFAGGKEAKDMGTHRIAAGWHRLAHSAQTGYNEGKRRAELNRLQKLSSRRT